MGEKHTTDHYDGDEHTRVTETEHDDGSKDIVESKVTDSALGEVGSNIVSETHVDSGGNSYTDRR